jgi:hypothetical protein
MSAANANVFPLHRLFSSASARRRSPVARAMTERPITRRPEPARLCTCERPLLLDAETCLRCGRLPALVAPAAVPAPPAGRTIVWTRARVVRAIRAFRSFRGRSPGPADWGAPVPDDCPAIGTVEGLFGSLDSALEAACVTSPPAGDARP